MPHIDDGILHAQLDGALDALEQAGALPDGATAADVLLHLESCADCSARLRDAMAVRERAGLVLQDVGGERIDVPPFSTLAGTVAGSPDASRSSFAARPTRRTTWLPLTWAATVMLAVGAGWWGSELYRTQPLRTADTAAPESTTSTRVQTDVQQDDAQSAAAPVANEMDAATSAEVASPPLSSDPAEQPSDVRAVPRERAFGSATQAAPPQEAAPQAAPPLASASSADALTVTGVQSFTESAMAPAVVTPLGAGIETFRAQVAIAQSAGAQWTVIDPAAADTLTAAYVIEDVADATFAVGVPLLGMSRLVRVQQRLSTGASVEMLMAHPAGVPLNEFSGTHAAALGLARQSGAAAARKAAPAAEAMRRPLGIDVVSSEQHEDGTSEVIVRVAETGAFINIRGPGTPAELAQLARRLVRPPGH